VLGGAGYIGAHAVRRLIELGHEVAVVDNLATGHERAMHYKARFYKGNLQDAEFLKSVFIKEGNISTVMHFAASSIVGESMVEPLKYFKNNVVGAEVLLETMRGMNVKRIVFSSSAAVYGNAGQVPITEEMTTNPTNAYGETKLMMEKMMKWCDTAYGIRYAALRYFNVAGAHEAHDLGEDHRTETHLIPLLMHVPLGKRKNLTVFGDDYDTPDGTCIRDYVHVQDLVDAHVLAMKYLEDGGVSDVFNLGSNQGFSVKEVVEMARQVTGNKIPVEIGARRAGDPGRLVASAEKAKRVLGWCPTRTSLKQIVEDAWGWHSSHPNGFKD